MFEIDGVRAWCSPGRVLRVRTREGQIISVLPRGTYAALNVLGKDTKKKIVEEWRVMIEVKAYESLTTKTVHLVGTFPSPLHDNTTQCGQLLARMKLMSVPLSQVPNHRLCLKCLQLLDLVP